MEIRTGRRRRRRRRRAETSLANAMASLATFRE